MQRRISTLAIRLILIIALLGMGMWIFPVRAQTESGSIYLPLIPRNFSGGPATVRGKVLNAQDGNIVGGVQVCIGGTSLCDVSDATLVNDYNYSISGVSGGRQTVYVTPPSGLVPLTQDVNVVGSQTNTINFALSQEITGDEIRIILTWDPTPQYNGIDNDLDAYLWVPGYDDSIYWGNLGNCDAQEDACRQDLDRRQGFGPETVQIMEPHPLAEHYQFAVFDYAGIQNKGLIPPITQRNARVDVYTSVGVTSFTVPLNGGSEDYCWFVFELEPVNRTIIPINEFVPYYDMCIDQQ